MKNVYDLQPSARAEGLEFIVIVQGDERYDKSREIANSRIHLYPSGIAYCKTTQDVAFCVNFCRDNKIQLRVRSGGHQHEGMSSADNVLIIDLSQIYGGEIKYLLGKDTAWIPAGRKLGGVYAELEKKALIVPGGGCQSVCVGGLTQGGGWGLSTRKKGMTCDNILAVEIIIPNGEIVEARADNEYADLFWAVRGGGGGNFGVITKYLFQLTRLAPEMTTFSLRWPKSKMFDITLAWINMHYNPETSNNLTTGCRLMVTNKEDIDGAMIVGGQFYGNREEALVALQPLFDVASPIHQEFTTHAYPQNAPKARGGMLETVSEEDNPTFLADRQGYLGSLLQPAARNPKSLEPPKQTCDAPHPHKVTSGFPKENIDVESLVGKMVEYIKNSETTSGANQYMTLHAMGGQVTAKPSDATAFFYRNKPIMLQVQAWWTNSGDGNYDYQNDQHLIKWVDDYRKYIEEYIEGAFINFVDKDLVKDISTLEGRLKILSYYYGDNLDRLIKVKSKYDSDNLFNFKLSIPVISNN